MALDPIARSVTYFLDWKATDVSGIPRTPSEPWGQHLRSKQLSYTGETLEVAQMMTFAEVEPGLPPVGYGAVVPLTDLLSDDVRSQIGESAAAFA